MHSELLRNGSGYIDYTAYRAIKNIKESENKMGFRRGEIFEYEMKDRSENAIALVVSADFRANDRFLSVIVLKDEPKGKVNVPIRCNAMMYADCGMVAFADSDRMLNFIRIATEEEMQQIDEGIAKCLGIEQQVSIVESEAVPETPKKTGFEEFKEIYLKTSEKVQQMEDIATAKAEANVYKNLYEQLLEKVMG